MLKSRMLLVQFWDLLPRTIFTLEERGGDQFVKILPSDKREGANCYRMIGGNSCVVEGSRGVYVDAEHYQAVEAEFVLARKSA